MTTEELATEDTAKVSEEDAAIRAEIRSEVWDDEGDNVNSKPVVEKEVESDKETEKEKEPETKTEETPPDPWEGVNPALKETLESMNYRLKQTEKRVGSIQNKANEPVAVKVDDTPTQEQIVESAKNEESWSQLKEDFPEWADAIDGRLAASSARLSKELPKLQDELKKTIKGIEDNFDRKLELRTVEFYHNDWEQVRDSADYKTWIQSQSDELKDGHQSSKAIDAIKVLNAYKEFKKPKEAEPDKGKTAEQIAADRKARLKKSTSLETTHTEKPIKSELDMSPEEIRKKIQREVWNEDG